MIKLYQSSQTGTEFCWQAWPAPAPTSIPTPPPRSPREVCTDRPNAISQAICENRECVRPQLYSTPYCVRLHRLQNEVNHAPPGSWPQTYHSQQLLI